MPRLTREELELHRAWLSDWRSPAEAARYVSEVNNSMGSTDFFGQSGAEFLRDAWLASKFGQLRGCGAVRLVPAADRWPDFEARRLGEVERVECVEADLPGRRRGDEYRRAEGCPTVENDPVDEWIARASATPTALANAISRKLAKKYPPGASLLVYLNIVSWGVGQAQIEAAMGKATEPALAHFRRVWILWEGRLHGPWQRQT